jgi:hypothetical protein
MRRAKAPATRRVPATIGWREHIGLPAFGIPTMRAKVDTGARTSALHAVDHAMVEVDGARWVEFMIPLHNRRTANRVRARLIGERDIKNTGGVPERRLVVRTTLLIGQRSWQIEVSLANREKMEFDLILGRTAIRDRGLLVDPGRSFVLGQPRAKARTRQSAPRSASTTFTGEKE